MDLKDFVKDVALNLDRNNAISYKNKAGLLVLDVDTMDGGELATIVNGISIETFEVKKNFKSEKEFIAAVLKIMKETQVVLKFAISFNMEYPQYFKDLNYKTKEFIADPKNNNIQYMTDEVIDYWLDNTQSEIFKQSNMSNDLYSVIKTDDKKLVTKVISHRNFMRVASQYPLRDLLTNKQNLLTKKTFDRAFTRMMEIINDNRGWNTDFSKELAPIGMSKYFTFNHFKMLRMDIREQRMVDYAIEKGIDIDTDILIYMYDKTNDDKYMVPELKELFVF